MKTKKIKLRHINQVNLRRTFVCKLLGGERGFGNDTNALETYSNDIVPTVRTMPNFTLIVEVDE